MAKRIRSQRSHPNPDQAVAHCKHSKIALTVAAMAACGQTAAPVLDQTTGESLEYKQLCKHPTLGHIWSKSYSNKLGRLCQGVGLDDNKSNPQIQGTNTFYVIDYDDIPPDQPKEII